MKSLSELCTFQLKDSYWYGQLNNLYILMDRETGYFNITKLFKGKNFNVWQNNKKSKIILDYLQKYAKPVTKDKKTYKVKYSLIGYNAKNCDYSGTYVCEDLITIVAHWISPEMGKLIDNYYGDNTFKNTMDVLRNKIKMVNRINLRNKKFAGDDSKSLKYVFFLMETDPNQYHIMRTKTRTKNAFLKSLKKTKYPNFKIIYEKKYNPKCINLYQRLKQLDNVKIYFNAIKLLDGYTIEKLKQDIDKLSEVHLKITDIL